MSGRPPQRRVRHFDDAGHLEKSIRSGGYSQLPRVFADAHGHVLQRGRQSGEPSTDGNATGCAVNTRMLDSRDYGGNPLVQQADTPTRTHRYRYNTEHGTHTEKRGSDHPKNMLTDTETTNTPRREPKKR